MLGSVAANSCQHIVVYAKRDVLHLHSICGTVLQRKTGRTADRRRNSGLETVTDGREGAYRNEWLRCSHSVFLVFSGGGGGGAQHRVQFVDADGFRWCAGL